jgi:hypothetical protein
VPRKKKSSSKKNLGILLLFFAGLLALVNFADLGKIREGGAIINAPAGVAARIYRLSQEEKLRLATDRVLDSFGISVHAIKYRGNDREVRVPANVPPAVVYQSLHRRIRELGGQIENGSEDLRTGVNALTYSFSGKKLGSIKLIPEPKLRRGAGRIAIIIDDFGYNRAEVYSGFFALPYPITYSVIPGLPHSQEVARRLQQQGKAIMIHLPMEPLEGRVEDSEFTLYTRLSENEIRGRVRKAVGELPQARGLNNHMGSLATVDGRLLRPALEEIRQANLFFIDSRTNPDTQAHILAKQLGLRTALNDLFLDANSDEDWISDKMMQLADRAAQKGWAIGIGHPNTNTLRVLRELGPVLQQRGFQFVPAIDLVSPPQLASAGAKSRAN